jgi:CRP/FNR family transcriptional regulator/CRP/FNR family cyclic AMP-dependent transcriptional regulator
METRADKIQILHRMPLFAGLSKRDLQAIAKITKEVKYRPRQVIIKTGERGTVLFLLTSGLVRVSVEGNRGKEMILGVLYPRDFFGEMALLDGLPRSATVMAVEESEVLVISRRDFLQCIRKLPKLAVKVIVTLSMRLRSMDQKVGRLVFLKASPRVVRTLLDLAEGRGVRAGGGIDLELPFTRRELAHLAGVSRETLTRLLTRFQRMGLLRIEGRRLFISEPDKLEALV